MDGLSVEPPHSEISRNEFLDSEDNDSCFIETLLVAPAKKKERKRKDRYFATIKAIKKEINRFDDCDGTRMYRFDPVLLEKNVDAKVLETLPARVGDVFVKLVVRQNCLYITSLSYGCAHSLAVPIIVAQASAWSRSVFSVKTDTTHKSADKCYGSAPDLVIEVPSGHRAPGEVDARLVIVEVEVNHRSVHDFREDLVYYFLEPNVVCVIGIKLFPRDKVVPTQRAMAVQWERQPCGIVQVANVWDFGLLPSTEYARSLFSTVRFNGLPEVDRNLWVQRRYNPINVHQLPAVARPRTADEFVQAACVFLSTLLELEPQLTTLYSDLSPHAVISGDRLVAYVHNRPAGAPELGALLGDFRLDLGRIILAVQRGAL